VGTSSDEGLNSPERCHLPPPPPPPPAPQVNTPANLKNLATAAKDAGYKFVYKGKIHLSKPIDPDYTWAAEDALQYGFTRWNFPDGGANQSLAESGGSPTFNDQRFMESNGSVAEGKEGVLQWILQEAAQSQPFFLVVSLINPRECRARCALRAGWGLWGGGGLFARGGSGGRGVGGALVSRAKAGCLDPTSRTPPPPHRRRRPVLPCAVQRVGVLHGSADGRHPASADLQRVAADQGAQ